MAALSQRRVATDDSALAGKLAFVREALQRTEFSSQWPEASTTPSNALFVCDTVAFRQLTRAAANNHQEHILEYLLSLIKLKGEWFSSNVLGEDVVGFDVSDNRLQAFSPVILSLLPLLRTLNISCNGMKLFPSDELWCADGFPFLQELRLDGNNLTTVPAYILQIPTLHILSICNNKLQKIPSEDPWRCLDLVSLNLSHNRLKTVPSQIFSLPVLSTLNLSGNILCDLPGADAWHLPELTSLDLSSNSLSDLPPFVSGQLPKLVSLRLGKNLFSAIPACVYLLNTVQVLDISHSTNIAHLAPQLYSMPALQALYLEGLGVPDIPKPLLAWGGSPDLLNFLRSRQQASEIFDQVQVVLLGASGVGKTSLETVLAAKRKLGETMLWQYRPGGFFVGGRRPMLTFLTWDLADEFEYHAAYRCFFSRQSLFVVVWSLQEGNMGVDGLSPWLSDIYAVAPAACVIIVGTHYDQYVAVQRARGVSADAIKANIEAFKHSIRKKYVRPGFPKIASLIEVGCTNQHNIPALKDLLYCAAMDVGSAYGRHGLDFPLPLPCVSLVRFLRSHGDELRMDGIAPVISFSGIQQLRSSDDALLDVTAADLHHALRFCQEYDFVVLLQSSDDADEDLYCLDPHWLSRTIGRVLAAVSRRSDGALHFSSLQIAMDSYKYPSSWSNYLLQYIAKQRLSLQLDSQRWLVPMALPDSYETLPAFLNAADKQLVYRRRYVVRAFPTDLWGYILAEILLCVSNSHRFMESHGSDADAVKIPFCQAIRNDASLNLNLDTSKLTTWCHGIAYGLSQTTGFVVQQLPLKDGINGVEVCVVCSEQSDCPEVHGLLGHVCHHIDHLIAIHYPGLKSTLQHDDPDTIACWVPCVCGHHNPADRRNTIHCIPFNDCLEYARKSTSAFTCPFMSDSPVNVDLQVLAPDLFLSNGKILPVSSFYEMNDSASPLKTNPKELFGIVNGDRVLLYQQAHMSTVRLDMAVLAQLDCSFVLNPIGISTEHTALVYSLPPCGSMDHVITTLKSVGQTLPWATLQRVVKQIAKGLAYLHSFNIVHGNVSLESVGIWSLCSHAEVNAKLLGAGVPAMRPSLHHCPGFVAPEVLRHRLLGGFSEKSDIFSLSIVLWSGLSMALPLTDLESAEVIDAAIVIGRRPPVNHLLARAVREPVVELMREMWAPHAKARPSAVEVAERLSSPLLRYLRQAVRISKEARIECAVSISPTQTGVVWLCCGDLRASQVIILRTGGANCPPSVSGGFWAGHSRILCACVVGDSVWLGTHGGGLYEYSIHSPSEQPRRTFLKGAAVVRAVSLMLADSIICIIHCPESARVFVSLANGCIFCFVATGGTGPLGEIAINHDGPVVDVAVQMETLTDTDPVLGGSFDVVDVVGRHPPRPALLSAEVQPQKAISSLLAVGDHIWCGGFGAIFVMDANNCKQITMWHVTRSGVVVEEHPNTPENKAENGSGTEPSRNGHSLVNLVHYLVQTPAGVWSAVRRDSVVCLWDDVDYICLRTIDCAHIVPPSIGLGSVVTCIVAVERSLWIALKTPCIVVCCPDHAAVGKLPRQTSSVSFCKCSVGGAVPSCDSCEHTVVLPLCSASPVLLPVVDADGDSCVLSGGDSAPPPGAVNHTPFHPGGTQGFSPVGVEVGTLLLWDAAVSCTAAS